MSLATDHAADLPVPPLAMYGEHGDEAAKREASEEGERVEHRRRIS